MVHPSLNKIYITLTYKTLHYNLNTNQQYTLTIQNSHHHYLKVIRTSQLFTESILKHKYVSSRRNAVKGQTTKNSSSQKSYIFI